MSESAWSIREIAAWVNGTWKQQVAFWSGVLAVILVVAYVIALLLVGNAKPGSPVAGILDRVGPGVVLVDPRADPAPLEKPLGMGSDKAGLALLSLSQVDRVYTEDDQPRRTPEGSNLIAFQVGDWACENKPCAGWETLDPQVVVNGVDQRLPEGGDTFVVVVPPGTETVDLTIDADGYTQSVSLVEEVLGEDNIVLLQARERDLKVELDRAFRLGERTSVQLQDANGRLTDTFIRDVRVESVERHFFLDGKTPSSPGKTFLVVTASYAYVGQTQRYVLPSTEVALVAKNGARYAATDLDPAADVAVIGFEVPAALRAVSIVIGGTTNELVSTNNVPYTSRLGVQRIPVKLG